MTAPEPDAIPRVGIPTSESEHVLAPERHSSQDSSTGDQDTPGHDSVASKSPGLSRNHSFSESSSYHDDWDPHTPLDRLTMMDLLDNFALPLQLEKLQKGISAQTEKVRRSKDAFKSKGQVARDQMVKEWRRRVPPAEEQLERYRKNMRRSMEKLSGRWNDTKVITLREKVSFICGVMNIFISGYLLGGFPEYFHLWYTAQLMYLMPIRFFTYQRQGLHYFLADLCYFVNFLLMLSMWVFPTSRRLFISVFSLTFGNNAIAIMLWRNSLVFHSFDKVTSLFIHIMPCAALHCIVHLYPADQQALRFPAAFNIKNAAPGSPDAYGSLPSILAWSSIPYAVWQLSYYFFITVRRREKIAAGRPTSFTWLRQSYSKVWIGKLVLSLPEALQESAFMLVQYSYAVLTMLPCPIWLYSRHASATYLMFVFTWSVYNGATYYIDVFGKRFQKDLEVMRAEVAKWQSNSELDTSPSLTPSSNTGLTGGTAASAPRSSGDSGVTEPKPDRGSVVDNVDDIPLLNDEKPLKAASTTALDSGLEIGARARKA